MFFLFIPQIPERKQLSVPKIESPEGYYEEAEPYDTSLNGTSWEQCEQANGIIWIILFKSPCSGLLEDELNMDM